MRLQLYPDNGLGIGNTSNAGQGVCLPAGVRIVPAQITPHLIARNIDGLPPRFFWRPRGIVFPANTSLSTQVNPQEVEYQFDVCAFTTPCEGVLTYRGVPNAGAIDYLNIVAYRAPLPSKKQVLRLTQRLIENQLAFRPFGVVGLQASANAPNLQIFEFPTVYTYTPGDDGRPLGISPNVIAVRSLNNCAIVWIVEL